MQFEIMLSKTQNRKPHHNVHFVKNSTTTSQRVLRCDVSGLCSVCGLMNNIPKICYLSFRIELLNLVSNRFYNTNH